jgi:sugar/nucleoside kinase (ribokinase family)
MKTLKKGMGVVGSTTIDQIVSEGQSFLKLGGATTYAGLTYRRHGIPTLIVSNLAERDLNILTKLKVEKIEVIGDATDQTTHFVNHIRGNRRYQELLQQAVPIVAEKIQAVIHRVDGLHLGPLHPLDIDPPALSFLRNSNLAIYLDVQGYTRMIRDRKVYPEVSNHLTEGLKAAQIIKVNGAEYRTILDFYQLDLADLMKKFNIKESVVTLGKNGGFVQTQNGATINYVAEPVKCQVDPTGAGDVFFAAYIVCRFSNKMHITDACRYAARIAALQVEGNYVTINQLGLD